MTAPYRSSAPSKKRKRTSSISSTSSENLDWDELTEVLWDCMRPHVQRMAVVNAAAEESNLPTSPGRAFTMPWKAIWERFIEVTGADVGRRSVQARGRTLISKRHKGERRHRWIAEEDDELLRAFGAVEQQCLTRGEPHVSDMDDKEKTMFWDTVYNCTTVRRTKKSMRERHLILEARASSGQSIHTSGSVESPCMYDVKHEDHMMIEPLDLSAPTSIENNDSYYFNSTNNVALQPIAVKHEELQQESEYCLDADAYIEIADLMWEEGQERELVSPNNINYDNTNSNYCYTQEPAYKPENGFNFGLNLRDENTFDEFIASDVPWTHQQPLATGMC